MAVSPQRLLRFSSLSKHRRTCRFHLTHQKHITRDTPPTANTNEMDWRGKAKTDMRKRDHARKGLSKTSEFLNLKPDGSLKSTRIDKLDDETLIRKQGLT